ncbi:MAG: FAD binding domain-containing protein [Treponema sp.]|jgi:CO/xanthine dehydrogenase FAD-binding subunit|nr:FAD binding domain-containing protein [Treponema sp.]
MKIREYRRAASLEEAWALLGESKDNCVLGGGVFLHKTSRQINIAVDLVDCGLCYIRETDADVLIGAYTCLRDIETSPLIRREFGSAFTEVLRHLIGVQLRNHITIGAHVYARFGFSDIIPVLLALNAGICLFRHGGMTLKDFMRAEARTFKGDILTEIRIPKEGRKTKVQMMRNSYADYSILCLAVSRSGGDWIVVAGARPGGAAFAEGAMSRLRSAPVSAEAIPALAEEIAGEFRFGDNFRASAEYRKELCLVFARRALEELIPPYEA